MKNTKQKFIMSYITLDVNVVKDFETCKRKRKYLYSNMFLDTCLTRLGQNRVWNENKIIFNRIKIRHSDSSRISCAKIRNVKPGKLITSSSSHWSASYPRGSNVLTQTKHAHNHLFHEQLDCTNTRAWHSLSMTPQSAEITPPHYSSASAMLTRRGTHRRTRFYPGASRSPGHVPWYTQHSFTYCSVLAICFEGANGESGRVCRFQGAQAWGLHWLVSLHPRQRWSFARQQALLRLGRMPNARSSDFLDQMYEDIWASGKRKMPTKTTFRDYKQQRWFPML